MTGRLKVKDRAEIVFDELEKLYPNTHCFLNYKEDYQLLFAVILSAQTTDIKVNAATSVLFERFKSLNDYTVDRIGEIESIIKPLGLAKSKSRYLVDTAETLIKKYDGIVPKDRDELMQLSGVGFKTSGVVLGELYNYPYIPVDTHVYRVTTRLGLVNSELTPSEVEIKLEKLYKEKSTIQLHRRFILFGRNICKAKTADCSNCPLRDVCKYHLTNS